MGAYQRTRGAVYEREVCQLLQQYGWPKARRTQDGRAQERGDIAHGPQGLIIECKRTERLRIRDAYAQAETAASEPGDIAVVVTRWDRGPHLAIVDFEELLALVSYGPVLGAAAREAGL